MRKIYIFKYKYIYIYIQKTGDKPSAKFCVIIIIIS